MLTNPDGGVYAPGAFLLALGALRAEPRITEAFRARARGSAGTSTTPTSASAANSSSGPGTWRT